MKRCCKNIDITDEEFILKCVYECFDEKWRRNEVVEIIRRYCGLSEQEVRAIIKAREYDRFRDGLRAFACDISADIKARRVKLKPIVKSMRIDRNSGKQREISKESILHQVYDYIAVNGIEELLKRKVGATQYACIKGRGQVKGMRQIRKWMRNDEKGTRYCIQSDMRKCYPSIPQDRLIAFLRHDIKNSDLLWLLEFLISQFDKGLGIGSYLSAHLCNYYLSYIWHFAYEKTGAKVRRGKKCKAVRHVVMYADDMIIFGANKRELQRAFEMIRAYAADVLGLEIKGTWKKRQNTGREFVDMLGFRITRRRVDVRRRTFKRIRRVTAKIERCRREHKAIHINTARRLMSYYGLVKNSDCHAWYEQHEGAFEIARAVISNFDRRKELCYR